MTLTLLMAGALSCAQALVFAAVASAQSQELSPQTRIRLTIIQWMPTKGVYEKWDALGGEFIVSENDTITLPVIGAISVGDLSGAQLGADIAKRLQDKIGLVQPPEATIDIVEQPPVYVVGDVNKPGEYKYHKGLTVLQSLAMSGGEFRPQSGNRSAADQTGYIGQLQEIDNDILRAEIRLVRFRAEMAGDKEMRPETTPAADSDLAASVFEQEKLIYGARKNDMERQAKSYGELRDLLTMEIDTTGKKIVGADDDIASIQRELTNVKKMVERGIALPTRQYDLERTLRGYHANRLDLVTSIMRARQNIAETTRNLDGLYDKQRTEVASDVQKEQAELDQLKVKRHTTQKLLLDALSAGATVPSQAGRIALVFTVMRQADGTVREMPASDATVLQPGDVVRVVRKVDGVGGMSTEIDGLPATSDAQEQQASQ